MSNPTSRLLCEEIISGWSKFDIEVLENSRSQFQEMPPIFKNVHVSRDDNGEIMKAFAEQHNFLTKPRRMLTGSMFGKNTLLITPLLQWYISYGLRITKIHQVIEYESRRCFEGAGRREARSAGEGRRSSWSWRFWPQEINHFRHGKINGKFLLRKDSDQQRKIHQGKIFQRYNLDPTTRSSRQSFFIPEQ